MVSAVEATRRFAVRFGTVNCALKTKSCSVIGY